MVEFMFKVCGSLDEVVYFVFEVVDVFGFEDVVEVGV